MFDDNEAKTQQENVLAAVAEGSLDSDAEEIGNARRKANRVRGLNHHAYYAKDVEATRHFYEDILEMPMTVFLDIPEEVFNRDPLPYAHFFFEMGDGSFLAFFDYPAFHDDGKASFKAPSVYDHHIALTVDSDEDIEYFKKRLESFDIDVEYIDHGAFHSIYFTDPNGLNVEFASFTPVTEEFLYRAANTAHDELKKWQKKRPSVPRSL